MVTKRPNYLNKDVYTNWRDVVGAMRSSMDDAQDVSPELRENIVKLLGGLDQNAPLPSKANFYKLARLKGKINGLRPIDHLLGAWGGLKPIKYNAYFNINDSEQMANLRQAIGIKKDAYRPGILRRNVHRHLRRG